MAAFRGPFHEGGLLDRRSLVRAILAQIVYLHLGASDQRLDRIRESVLRLTKGWQRDRVAAVIEETLETVVEPIIYAEAMDLMERHQEEGRLVVIVSASPEEIVGPLGRHLEVDRTIASRAALDEQGRYTGQMGFYAYGPYKAQAMQELAATRGDRPRTLLRLHRLLHGPADAGSGRPPGRRQPGPGAGAARARAWLGGHALRPAGAPRATGSGTG